MEERIKKNNLGNKFDGESNSGLVNLISKEDVLTEFGCIIGIAILPVALAVPIALYGACYAINVFFKNKIEKNTNGREYRITPHDYR